MVSFPPCFFKYFFISYPKSDVIETILQTIMSVADIGKNSENKYFTFKIEYVYDFIYSYVFSSRSNVKILHTFFVAIFVQSKN
jgi:hypothetical protein